MKKLRIVFMLGLGLLLTEGGLFAQKKVESEAATVKFSFEDEAKLQVGGKTKILVEITPKANWHVYSAIPSDDGAYQPAVLGWEITSRGFEAGPKLEEEGIMTSNFDEIMNGTVRFYKSKVVFSQELKLTETEVILAGYFDYMACNEEKCIPITADFSIEAKAKK